MACDLNQHSTKYFKAAEKQDIIRKIHAYSHLAISLIIDVGSAHSNTTKTTEAVTVTKYSLLSKSSTKYMKLKYPVLTAQTDLFHAHKSFALKGRYQLSVEVYFIGTVSIFCIQVRI